MSEWHEGVWMQTYTGRMFFPMEPRAIDVDALDISHSLGMQCRYNGHVQRFYSVAEHCVLMSEAVSPKNALKALLHDATEAYVGDMVRPLKLNMPEFVAAEARVWLAICEAFDISPEIPDEVHAADSRTLLTERRALLTVSPGPWGVEGLEPLPVEIMAWSPQQAAFEYSRRLESLTGVSRG